MNHLNLQQILYFKEIAEMGSIAKAASNLKISSPALSMQLSTLEQSLGHKLFDRQGRSLKINEFGEQVLKHAKSLFGLRSEILALSNNFDQHSVQRVKLGFYDGLPKSLAINVYSFFHHRPEGVVVEMSENTNDNLKRALLSNRMEGVFTNRAFFEESASIRSITMGKSPLSFYGSQKFRKLTKNFPHSLDMQDLILPSLNSDTRYTLENWLNENEIRYKLRAEVHDSGVKKQLAEKSYGLILLPEIGARQLVREKKLYKIGHLKNMYETYYLTVLRNKRERSQPLNELIEHLENSSFLT